MYFRAARHVPGSRTPTSAWISRQISSVACRAPPWTTARIDVSARLYSSVRTCARLVDMRKACP
jgi:hypothetical protein